jgi:hypothetical protein
MTPDIFDWFTEQRLAGIPIGKTPGAFGVVKLPDAGRTLGTRVVGEAGSGKSVLLAAIAFGDFVRGIPVVLWDHNGGLIDAFFAQVLGQTESQALQERIRYVDFGHPEFAYGMPFYYDAGGDDPYVMSQRFVDMLLKLDPELSKAPVLGESSLVQLGTMVGTILSAYQDEAGNRWQVTEAPDLLLNFNSPRWAKIRHELGDKITPAENFLTQTFSKLTPTERRKLSWSFESRIWPYLNSPSLKATVGQGRPTINWQEVVEKQLAVIFDFRNLMNQKPLEHLSLLTFDYFLTYLKKRGIGATQPISLVIDEIPALLEYQSLEPDVRSLATRFRAYKLWPTIGHQALYQLSPKLRGAAWSFRNQLVGQQANVNDAGDVVKNLLGIADPIEQYAVVQLLQRLPSRRFLFRRQRTEQESDKETYWIKTLDVSGLGQITPEVIAEAKRENQQRFAPRGADALQDIDGRLLKGTDLRQARPVLTIESGDATPSGFERE